MDLCSQLLFFIPSILVILNPGVYKEKWLDIILSSFFFNSLILRAPPEDICILPKRKENRK